MSANLLADKNVTVDGAGYKIPANHTAYIRVFLIASNNRKEAYVKNKMASREFDRLAVVLREANTEFALLNPLRKCSPIAFLKLCDSI